MEIVVVGLVAVVAVLIVACLIMWINGNDFEARIKALEAKSEVQERYRVFHSTQPRSPVEDEVEAALPWESFEGE